MATDIYDPERDLYVVPVRHHSPACAAHLAALIGTVQPGAILIEGPCDFDPLIPLLGNAGTVPPVAVVAVDERKGEDGGSRVVSYFPFCAHSPEYVALTLGTERGLPVAFIDLPMSHRVMRDDDDARAPQSEDEKRLTSNDYVRALCRRLGCRDGNEVWDHLFETQLHLTDWRSFFGGVATYCGHIRACTDPAQMEGDGTLAREAQMRGLIRDTRHRIKGPIVAVVGGFHASPLLDRRDGEVVKASGGRAYLVRYGHRQLNALTGYRAGLPLPAYYEGLWARRAQGPDLYADCAADLVTTFAAHVRNRIPGFTPSLPTVGSALENAHLLAELRGRPGPLRDDLLDACRSAFLKGEDSGDAAPVMSELMAFLTGSALGDVPPSAGSPPLVEAARSRARSLGFTLDDGERRNRDLDLYRKARHRDASRFLHAMTFLETGFGHRTAGPDFRIGVDLDRLHEIWSVAWSPSVEARLIELATDADTVEGAVAVAARRRLRDLETQGQGNNASAAIDLFIAACQAGIAAETGRILPFIADQVAGDSELKTVAGALRNLVQLWRNAPALGLGERGDIEKRLGDAWRRALFLLPNIASFGEDQVSDALSGFVTLREAAELAAGQIPGIASGDFDDAAVALLGADLNPALAGAVSAVALLGGHADAAWLGARLRGDLAGAYGDARDRVAFLRGVITVSRELLWSVPELAATMDEVLDAVGADDFLALLPHMRLALTGLDPRDIDRLARTVVNSRGGDAARITEAFAVTEAEMAANMALDRAVAARLAEAGVT
ncbi:DUF5682 family protein [Asticcacaulis benevestitus]|uniref:Uncharacterized protein n=1 Tax=Asticcacaulis benevestitus DSM 16100 = ATCC BAA-896 TaxID=1121022 RepID=V4P6N2_9CAUL|nr:DUF5682 family protein [Asticcacaulis benevestitus]ESQ82779.1 hypothetical protein ABENE_20735 [Asticcacaulis benevestitus DSM 16100 = ATCC BAA-896]